MRNARISLFRYPYKAESFLKNWCEKIEKLNGYTYDKIQIETSLGITQVYGFNTTNLALETIVIFPGYRTSALIWDLDKGLHNISKSYRIFMIETNGQPNLSTGKSPSIKSLDYGYWANEVLNELGIMKANIIGASFGGLVCMKLALTNPERIKSAFLLNAACLQPFSLSFKNLYYNLLPVLYTNRKNVNAFLNKIVFSKPNHTLSKEADELLSEYILFVLKNHIDKNQKPYYMAKELSKAKVKTYLLHGKNDLLFPFQKSIKNGIKHFKSIEEITTYDNVGHGIETYAEAINFIKNKLNQLT